MIFNTYTNLGGTHAFLSPSNYHWINYDEEKLEETFFKTMTARLGTELHEFAHRAIKLGIRLPEVSKTLNLYVNDAIGFRMTSEQTLYYSINCYGHADTISFRHESASNQKLLRIHDLKNGVTEASVHQLEVYAALFCLEYKFSPFDIKIELRIYQNDEVRVYEGDSMQISLIMRKIVDFDKRIEALRLEGMR